MVEAADRPPTPKLTECPNCSADNLAEAEECQVCGAVLIGIECVNKNCESLILRSAVTCQVCGASQTPDIEEPWLCNVCGRTNSAEQERCSNCMSPAGAPNPASREFLISNSNKDDERSIAGLTIDLADNSFSQPVEVDVYITRGPITPTWKGAAVPVLAVKGERIEVFADLSHPVFRAYRARPEVFIAAEIGQYLYDLHRSLLRSPYIGTHSVSNLAWQIIEKYWAEEMEDYDDPYITNQTGTQPWILRFRRIVV